MNFGVLLAPIVFPGFNEEHPTFVSWQCNYIITGRDCIVQTEVTGHDSELAGQELLELFCVLFGEFDIHSVAERIRTSTSQRLALVPLPIGLQRRESFHHDFHRFTVSVTHDGVPLQAVSSSPGGPRPGERIENRVANVAKDADDPFQ